MSASVMFAMGVLTVLYAVTAVSRRYWKNAYLDLGREHARTLDELENLRSALHTPYVAHTGDFDDPARLRPGPGVQRMPQTETPRVVPPRGTRFAGQAAAGQPLPGVQAGSRLSPSGEETRSGGPPDYRRYAGETLAETNRPVRPVPPPDDLG